MPFRHAVLLLAGASLAACDDDPTGITDPAFLRVINASPALTTLDVVVDGRAVATAVASGTASEECVRVPSGAQEVEVRSDGETVATVDADLVDGERFTLLVTGSGTADVAAALTDDWPSSSPGEGFMFLRFANATPSVGQVYVTQPAGEIGDVPTFIVGAGEVTDFAQLPVTDTRVRLYEGTTSPPPGDAVADVVVGSLPASRIGTVVLTGDVEGSDVAGFFVPRCS